MVYWSIQDTKTMLFFSESTVIEYTMFLKLDSVTAGIET